MKGRQTRPQPTNPSKSLVLAGLRKKGDMVVGIVSSKTLSGTAADYVMVVSDKRNISQQPSRAYYIGAIDVGQTLPLNWKIHFVKAGEYSLIIVATTAGREVPEVSSITHFQVNPKRNLNPGNILPAAWSRSK